MIRDEPSEALRVIGAEDNKWMREHPDRRFHIRLAHPIEACFRVWPYLSTAIAFERRGERIWRSRRIYVLGLPVDTDSFIASAIETHDNVIWPLLLDDTRRSE